WPEVAASSAMASGVPDVSSPSSSPDARAPWVDLPSTVGSPVSCLGDDSSVILPVASSLIESPVLQAARGMRNIKPVMSIHFLALNIGSPHDSGTMRPLYT